MLALPPSAARITACLILLAVGSCARSTPPPSSRPCPRALVVTLRPSERLNPDAGGTPLPTRIRLLQLRRAERLEEADVTQLYERLEQTLADDLLQTRELTVFPARAVRVSITLDPQSRYLVGLAIFRQPRGAAWRALVPLDAPPLSCAAHTSASQPPSAGFLLDGHRIESVAPEPGNAATLPGELAVSVR